MNSPLKRRTVQDWLGRVAWQLVVGWILIGGAGPVAHAASVSLTTAVNVPTAATLVPFTYTVTFGNSTTPNATAVNAPISLALPADLYNIAIVSAVGTGGASCPAAAAFSGVPAADALTNGSEVMTAAIASLPTNAECTITIAATALRSKTYPLQAIIQPGPGDVLSGSANDSFGNTVVTPSTLHLAVEKSVLGPTPILAGDSGGIEPYGSVTYQVVYRNNSPMDIPMDLVGDTFYDSETAQADAYPGTQPTNIINCVATGGTLCPSLTPDGASFNSSGFTNPLLISNPGGPGGVFRANSSITITYERTYTAPVCGAASITNTAVWGSDSRYGNIIWDTAGGSGNSNAVSFALTPDVAACTPLPIAPTVTKVLDGITDGAGTVKTTTAPFNITASGDTAHYTVTVHGDPTYGPVRFRFSDGVWSPSGQQPTFLPNGSVLQTATMDSCTITGAGAGACPENIPGYPYALPGETATPDFKAYLADTIQLDAGQTMVLKMSLKYTISGASCNAVADQLLNVFTLTATEPPSGYVYSGAMSDVYVDTSATPLTILPALARCVDMTSNKQVSTVSPLAGAPFTFTLDYTNSTSSTTGNTSSDPLTGVAITDRLGAAFTPSAVSCTVVSGTATAPSVSLANITGADHTFDAVIPSIADAAIVRCTVTGSTSLPGTYTNLTRTTVSTAGLVDAKPSNDTSQVNYGVVGTQVLLTQTVSPVGQVAPGSTLVYTVTAVAGGRAADGTVLRDALPAEIQSFSWSCSASGGAVCPLASSGAAGVGGAPLNETVAAFPVGSSVTYTITAIVKAAPPTTTVTTVASAVLPPNASCLPSFSASPCIAQVSNSLPAAGPGGTPGGGAGGGGEVTAVPVDAPWMLSLLGLVLGTLGAQRVRGGRRG